MSSRNKSENDAENGEFRQEINPKYVSVEILNALHQKNLVESSQGFHAVDIPSKIVKKVFGAEEKTDLEAEVGSFDPQMGKILPKQGAFKLGPEKSMEASTKIKEATTKEPDDSVGVMDEDGERNCHRSKSLIGLSETLEVAQETFDKHFHRESVPQEGEIEPSQHNGERISLDEKEYNGEEQKTISTRTHLMKLSTSGAVGRESDTNFEQFEVYSASRQIDESKKLGLGLNISEESVQDIFTKFVSGVLSVDEVCERISNSDLDGLLQTTESKFTTQEEFYKLSAEVDKTKNEIWAVENSLLEVEAVVKGFSEQSSQLLKQIPSPINEAKMVPYPRSETQEELLNYLDQIKPNCLTHDVVTRILEVAIERSLKNERSKVRDLSLQRPNLFQSSFKEMPSLSSLSNQDAITKDTFDTIKRLKLAPSNHNLKLCLSSAG